MNKKNFTKGFLLIELIVALFLFSVVMEVSIGAILPALDANKKTQTLKSAMNNLNLAVDEISKALAVGTVFDCFGENPPIANDCATTGGNTISFNSQDNNVVTFSWHPPDGTSAGYISRQIGAAPAVRLTAEEISITSLLFYVTGSANSDSIQPRVAIFVKGTARPNQKDSSDFFLQTLVSARVPDFLVNGGGN